MLRRTMLALLIAFSAVATMPSTSRAFVVVCCDAGDISTMKDLAYIATTANPPETIKPRLVTLINVLKDGTWRAWNDPDRGLILGYVASTPDGVYWRDRLIVPFASVIGVTLKSVTPSVEPPPPIVVVPPAPPPTSTSSLTEDQIRAIVRDEIAKNPPTTSTSSSAYPDLIDQGNGELIFLGKDIGTNPRQTDDNGNRVSGDFKARFGVNNYDMGLRALNNWNYESTPNLPYGTFGMDSRSTFSYNQTPKKSENTNPARVYGQAFVIDGGFAQAGYDYETGAELKRGVLLASQRGGVDILFAVTPWRNVGDPVLNKTVFRLRSDGSANPVDAVIDGRLQTLKGCNVGGFRVVCF